MQGYFYILVVLLTWKCSEGVDTIHRCLASADKNIDISCKDGDKIQVLEVVYGRNKWQSGSTCFHVVGECSQPSQDGRECCGKTDCQFSLGKPYMPSCDGFSTFYRIRYQCVRNDYFLNCTTSVTKNQQEISTDKPGKPSDHTVSISQGRDLVADITNTPSNRPPATVPLYASSDSMQDSEFINVCVSIGMTVALVSICLVILIIFCHRKTKLSQSQSNLIKRGTASPFCGNTSSASENSSVNLSVESTRARPTLSNDYEKPWDTPDRLHAITVDMTCDDPLSHMYESPREVIGQEASDIDDDNNADEPDSDPVNLSPYSVITMTHSHNSACTDKTNKSLPPAPPQRTITLIKQPPYKENK